MAISAYACLQLLQQQLVVKPATIEPASGPLLAVPGCVLRACWRLTVVMGGGSCWHHGVSLKDEGGRGAREEGGLTGTPFVCAALIQPGGGMVTSAWLK